MKDVPGLIKVKKPVVINDAVRQTKLHELMSHVSFTQQHLHLIRLGITYIAQQANLLYMSFSSLSNKKIAPKCINYMFSFFQIYDVFTKNYNQVLTHSCLFSKLIKIKLYRNTL
jgi:hypothetical protein